MNTGPSADSTPPHDEIHRLHEDRFAASPRKDLDASMAPIDDTIVSYEQAAPLPCTSVGAIRDECRRGFENAGDNIIWTVTDLHIVADGDLAVAWGLNQMTNHQSDGSESVTSVARRPVRVGHRAPAAGRLPAGCRVRIAPSGGAHRPHIQHLHRDLPAGAC